MERTPNARRIARRNRRDIRRVFRIPRRLMRRGRLPGWVRHAKVNRCGVEIEPRDRKDGR